MAATSIFRIVTIASQVRSAAARSGPVNAFVRVTGVLSSHHPHWLSRPPFPTIASQ
jgi:hypothetical protein